MQPSNQQAVALVRSVRTENPWDQRSKCWSSPGEMIVAQQKKEAFFVLNPAERTYWWTKNDRPKIHIFFFLARLPPWGGALAVIVDSFFPARPAAPGGVRSVGSAVRRTGNGAEVIRERAEGRPPQPVGLPCLGADGGAGWPDRSSAEDLQGDAMLPQRDQRGEGRGVEKVFHRDAQRGIVREEYGVTPRR